MIITAEVVAGYSFLMGLCGGLGFFSSLVVWNVVRRIWREMSDI